MARSVHRCRGYLIVPDSRGWAVSWSKLTVFPAHEVELGVNPPTEREHMTAFFAKLVEAREFCRNLQNGILPTDETEI
jgi:hypothetical protein